MEIFSCMCEAFPSAHCTRPVTQEDFLCDECRTYKLDPSVGHIQYGLDTHHLNGVVALVPLSSLPRFPEW